MKKEVGKKTFCDDKHCQVKAWKMSTQTLDWFPSNNLVNFLHIFYKVSSNSFSTAAYLPSL